jgi:peptidoglycan/LPS O-acetylase OafA/YrhL
MFQFFEPIQVAWSISTEIFLYFLYPLICLWLICFHSYSWNVVIVAACMAGALIDFRPGGVQRGGDRNGG